MEEIRSLRLRCKSLADFPHPQAPVVLTGVGGRDFFAGEDRTDPSFAWAARGDLGRTVLCSSARSVVSCLQLTAPGFPFISPQLIIPGQLSLGNSGPNPRPPLEPLHECRERFTREFSAHHPQRLYRALDRSRLPFVLDQRIHSRL